MKVAVVGTGYVGLVTGTCLSQTGVSVVCIDINQQKIDNLRKGIIPIFEPGLDDLVIKNTEENRLTFSTDLNESIQGCEAIFIAVGTPSDEDGSADLQYVIGVAKEIGKSLTNYTVIITKSTVPVGTSFKVKDAINFELQKRGATIEFDVASNPEFLKEGAAIEDFMKPDRIVVGTESERAEKVLKRIYKPFIMNGHPLIFMNIPSAELTKYAANAMLATRISFMNDIANLCEIVGADINLIRKGIGTDTRIGSKFLYPGIGYGGSCFPKDVKAIIKTAKDLNYDLQVLKAVEAVNENQKSILFNKLNSHFNGQLQGKKIALWGLSFKPNTDDMREAPSLVMIKKMLDAGCEITAFDPVAIEEAKQIIGNGISYSKHQYDGLENADALIVLTEWQVFRMPDFDKISNLLKNKLIFDGRNIFDIEDMKELGYTYYSIGRTLIN
jgi:UDPglucose 6-dehydrogenase